MSQIDYNDPKYQEAAAAILQRHDNNEPEANITSAVRDFLLCTGLVDANKVAEEVSPSDRSVRAVDLRASNTFIEIKKRIGTTGGFNPNETYLKQLDEYLAESMTYGRKARMGVLTDGRYWLLRWPNAGKVKTTKPYAFTLESAADWLLLYEWLRDKVIGTQDDIPAQRTEVEQNFGPNSPLYRWDIDGLNVLYQGAKDRETVRVKCRLWETLLRAALGEIAQTPDELDDLFVRHTYLSMVIGMVVQAYFGIDIRERAANDPTDLLYGRQFRDDTGLQDIIESDFFTWPAEVGGESLIERMAEHVARFNWKEAPPDIAATLYEAIIPPDERRQLGEYYTPEWLAQEMVQEVVTDPLRQRVLDPSCGSGTFVAVSVRHFVEAATEEALEPKEALERLREAVMGIDVHPVAVRLARTAWVMAARPLLEAAAEAGYEGNVAIPVYLGDALQLHYQTGDLFVGGDIGIEVEGDEFDKRLIFPIRLVEQADTFDRLMSDVADAIERGHDPLVALDDHGITDPGQRQTLATTIAIMQDLHAEGRNHIWAYYTRNLVRPVALSLHKVDVIVGNPPWLNYRNTASVLRDKLVQQSKELYHIWQGGRYATHQDVAGLFFARSVALYLKAGGTIAMVLPHSALQTGQYAKWRTGRWGDLAVNFGCKTAWDLEKLEPNTFFPVASCVVFAERMGELAPATPLTDEVEQWQGTTGAEDVRRERMAITDTSVSGTSPYADRFRQGASIVPRCLFFVHEVEGTTLVRAAQTVKVEPRRGSNDKAPWKTLDLTAITGQTIEKTHLFDVHLGETVVPYATLPPLKALLPLKQNDHELPVDPNGTGGIHLGGLEQRMRGRWQQVSSLWEQHKRANTSESLLNWLDYNGKLSAQLEWQKTNKSLSSIRVVYTTSGQSTAAIIDASEAIVDHKLFWAPCKDLQEAHYVLAIINSRTLYETAQPLMAKGQFGARDLHKHLLKNVHEGWYVEYKRQMIKASALAKSLSAFANTYGGWLFIGVQEQSGDNTVAGEFPGIPEEDVDGALKILRHSAADHLNPTPFFETTVLRGPCDENGLAEGKAIIAVEIPQSHTAPHVHKDGRIYRRVADGSEPKPETDRFVLDQLWRRAEPLRKMTRNWIKRDPEFSQKDEGISYVRLLLCVDPWRQRDPLIGAPLSEIRRILKGGETSLPSVPFDTIYTTEEGLTARQLKGNDPANYGLTWRLRWNMSCDVVLPLQLHAPDVPDHLIGEFDGYVHAERFIDMLNEQGHTRPRIADLNFMLRLLLGIVSQYRHLLKLAGAGGEFYCKARVLNAWRMVPFVDVETLLDEFKAHGLPMVMDRTVTVPTGDAPESFVHIYEDLKLKGEEDKEFTFIILQAIRIFALVVPAFGVPIYIENETMADSTTRLYSELIGVGERALTVQQNRNKRRAEV